MKQAEKFFPYDRSMMLNIIYDAFDYLGVTVKSSNSEQGRIEFQAENGRIFVLWISTVYPQETVRLRIVSEDGYMDCKFADALFDEINSIIATTRVKR